MSKAQIKVSPVRVLLFDYAVEDVLDLRDAGGPELEGDISHDTLVIRIRDGMDSAKRNQVLWHEILHAIATQMHIKFRNDEDLDRLATGVIAVLRDNPVLRNPQ